MFRLLLKVGIKKLETRFATEMFEQVINSINNLSENKNSILIKKNF